MACSRALAVGAKDGALSGPVTAESGVEDDLHVVEVVVDVASRSALEVRRRSPPCRWVGVCARGVRGGLAFGPEPDVNVVRVPFGGVDASTRAVEAVSVQGRASAVDATSLVGETGAAGHGAAVGGVHGHDVAGLVVYTFKDIDFAISGPMKTSTSVHTRCCCLLTKREGQASKMQARYRRRYRACEPGQGRPGRVGMSCRLRRGHCLGPGQKPRWWSPRAY